MANTLLSLFSAELPVVVDRTFADTLHNHRIRFEVRDNHPMAFNTPTLGVYKAKFLNTDRAFLFELAGLTEREVSRVSRLCPAVDPRHRVITDPYNLLVVWIAHNALANSVLPQYLRRQVAEDVLVMLHYKIFTSSVQRDYKHGADPETMNLTIERISGKFGIKKEETSTWALTIRSRVNDMLSPDGIHAKTFATFLPDEKVLYIISNLRSGIVRRMVNINQVYYELKHKGDKLGDRTLTTEVDGESVLKHVESAFDQMQAGLMAAATQTDRMIRSDDIRLVCRLCGLRQEDMFRRLLHHFVEMAAKQSTVRAYDLLQPRKGKRPLMIGYRVLLIGILQSTYGGLVREQMFDVRNRADILSRTVNLYRSSRVTDEEVLTTKDSVDDMIGRFDITRREATRSSLKITFIVYVMLLALRYM